MKREGVFRVHTIGSLRTLKLVLTSTGQPVRAWKLEGAHGIAGWSPVDGLNARRVIDVGDRWISERGTLSLSMRTAISRLLHRTTASFEDVCNQHM